MNQYFKTNKSDSPRFGIRYFRVDFTDESVKALQICETVGAEVKKGKANNVGIYTISRMTLMCNYMAMCYVQPCTKQEFDSAFKRMVQRLK